MRQLLFVILFIISSLAEAQKVGLVLSGGGARGIAHLGVLRALEENNIPIHYITGTSMGGLIGGFYAAGYSVEDIEEIIFSAEFQDWVNGRSGDAYNFYFTSNKNQADWISFNLNIDSSFQASIGTNFVSDLPLNFALAEKLAAPSHRMNNNFDSLFIPLRVMASEVFTQQSLALDSGLLSNALRATMSVPYFFRPIKWGGMYLLDGGIYSNFPVKEMEDAFNPDIIIGVNVSVKRYKEYPYEEAEKLIGTSLLRMILDKPDVDSGSDNLVYIEPNLNAFSSFDFKEARALAKEGYRASIQEMGKIKSLIATEIECEERAAERHQFTENFEPLIIKKLGLEGFNKSQQYYINRNFKKREGGALGISEARQKYYKLVSESYFQNIIPEIIYDNEIDGFALNIKKQGKNRVSVDLGGNISTRNISTIYLGLNYSHLNFILFNHSANFYTGRFYNSARYDLRLNFPSIVPLFFEPFVSYSSFDFLSTSEILNENTNPKAVKQNEFFTGIDAALPWGNDKRFKLRSAYFEQNNRFSNTFDFVSSDTLDQSKFSGFRLGFELSSNTLNRKMYPTRGRAFALTADYVRSTFSHFPGSTALDRNISLQNDSYFRLKASAEKYYHLERFIFGFNTEALLSNHPLMPTYWATVSTMDQYNPLNDSPTLFLEQFRARSYFAGGLKFIYPILNNLDWRAEFHAFKPLRRVFPDEEQNASLSDFIDLQFSLASYSALVYHSPIGPISASVNYHDDVRQRLTFMVHIGFILFNDRIFE